MKVITECHKYHKYELENFEAKDQPGQVIQFIEKKPTMWLNPQKTLIHIEYGSADLILDRSEALSLAERLPSLVGQMGEIA